MTDDYDFALGIVAGFHALAGEVKVRPVTNDHGILLALKTVRAEAAPGMNRVVNKLVVKSARLERNMLLLSFDGYGDRTAVEPLEGCELFAKSSELLPLEQEQFWVRDLVGLDVFTTGGQRVGKIISIIYGGNDLLEIQRDDDPPGKTVLVPFVHDLVPVVDLAGKRVEVVDVPGLLEAQ